MSYWHMSYCSAFVYFYFFLYLSSNTPFIFLFSYFSRVLIVSPCLSFSLNSLFTINNLRQEMPSFINDAVNETGAAFVGDKNFNQLIPCN